MNHFFSKVLAVIFKKLTKDEKNEQSTVATYGGKFKLYIIQIRFYLFFRFTEKVRGTKTEKYDVDTYCGRIHVNIFSRYGYLDNVSSIDCR